MAKYKNSVAGTVVNVLALILVVVGCGIAYYANSIEGYALASFDKILIVAAASAACALLATIIEAAAGPQNFFAFLVKWVAVVAAMIMIALMVNDKVQDVSALFSWDSANEFGWNSFYVCVASIASELVAVIFMIATAFGKGKKIA